MERLLQIKFNFQVELGFKAIVYIIKQDIRIYMLPIAGQTAGLNVLKFFGHSWVTQGV